MIGQRAGAHLVGWGTGILVLAAGPGLAQALSNRLLSPPLPTSGYTRSATGAGDVNGDGYSDVIVSRWSQETAQLFLGGPSGVDGTADVTYAGSGPSEWFGYSIAGLGDINGDGFDDVAVGAPFNDAEAFEAGHVYVFLGGRVPDGTADMVLSLRAAGYRFGFSLDGAGDVNRDGFRDILVGSEAGMWSGCGPCSKQAWIYFGGSAPDTTVDVRLQGSSIGLFGEYVRGAGDVNGDGYDDVVGGAPAFGNGYAHVFYGGTSMDGVCDLTYSQPTLSSTQFGGYGLKVGPAGDLNGDGYADVAVCNPQHPAGGPDAGRVFVYYGGGSPDTTADLILTGDAGGDFFGTSAGSAGDANGDGYDDLLIGAMGVDFGASPWTGGAYLFLGGPGLSATPNLKWIPAMTHSREFGIALDRVGDVDGDGRDDAIIAGNTDSYVVSFFPYQVLSPKGGDRWVSGGSETVRWRGHDLADLSISVDGGQTWSVVARHVGGQDENELRVLVPGVATEYARVRVTYADQSPSRATSCESDGVFRIVSPTTPLSVASRPQRYFFNLEFGDMLGFSVAGGDANGDGFGDLFVGAPFRDASGPDAGCAFVYLGGPGADEAPDAITNGPVPEERMGISVAFVGDVNGDGIEDRVAGSSGTATTPGTVHFFYGGGTPPDPGADFVLVGEAGLDQFGAALAGTGDLNGDGFADILVGARGYNALPAAPEAGRAYVFLGGPTFDTVPDLVVTGTAAGDDLGVSVSGAGDVNGDGYDDFLVGAPGHDAAALDAGRAYLYYGSSTLDAVPDLMLDGASAGDGFGSGVKGVGDIDADGFDDLAVAAPGSDAGGVDAGRVYLYLGARDGARSTPIVPDGIVTGEEPYNSLGTIAAVGDVNRDGFADFALGSTVNDAGGALAGRTYVFFGSTRPDAHADVVLTGESQFGQFGASVASSDFNGDGFPDLAIGAPSDLTSGAGYVTLYDFNRYLVESPIAGDTWNVGAFRTIAWRGAERSNLWLTVDGGQTYELLKANVGGGERNTFSLRVPHQPTRFARVRVTAADPTVVGAAVSDSFFTINVSVELLSLLVAPLPSGGAEISWRTNPAPPDLRGYRLETDGGSPGGTGDWRTLVALTSDTRAVVESAQPGARFRLYSVNGLGEELLVGEASAPVPKPISTGPLPYRGDLLRVSFATRSEAVGRPGRLEVALFDVGGRLVRWLARGEAMDGFQDVVWDGRDEQGRAVRNGVYFLRIVSAGHTTTSKIPVLR
jgi:hypothetical protein